jgi:hypothetical protein
MYINTDWIKSEIGVLQILTGVAVFFVYPNPAGKGSHWTQLEISPVLELQRKLLLYSKILE